jgi:hypothetical protein
MKHLSGFAWLPLLLSLAVVAGVGGGAYYITHQRDQQDTSIQLSNGWSEYKNSKFNLSFQYPNNLNVSVTPVTSYQEGYSADVLHSEHGAPNLDILILGSFELAGRSTYGGTIVSDVNVDVQSSKNPRKPDGTGLFYVGTQVSNGVSWTIMDQKILNLGKIENIIYAQSDAHNGFKLHVKIDPVDEKDLQNYTEILKKVLANTDVVNQ